MGWGFGRPFHEKTFTSGGKKRAYTTRWVRCVVD
jgi:hypothetical protein